MFKSLTSKYGLGQAGEAPGYFIRISVCFVSVVTPPSYVLPPDVTACNAPVICHDASDILSRDDGPVM